MQTIDLKIPGYAQAVIGSLATATALSVLGIVLAYWTWVFYSPHSVPRSRTAMSASGGNEIETASRLFGSMAQGNQGSGSGPNGIALKLHGVVAAPGTQSGYAVIRLDAKRIVAVREGGEIEPGVRLLEVHADHVVMERNGQRETHAWIVQGQTRALVQTQGHGQEQGKVLDPNARGVKH